MCAAHDRAFVIAGAMKADLITRFTRRDWKLLLKVSTLDEFLWDFKNIVQKHGWTGWKGEGTKAGEAWRTKVIWETNLLTSRRRWTLCANDWSRVTRNVPFLTGNIATPIMSPVRALCMCLGTAWCCRPTTLGLRRIGRRMVGAVIAKWGHSAHVILFSILFSYLSTSWYAIVKSERMGIEFKAYCLRYSIKLYFITHDFTIENLCINKVLRSVETKSTYHVFSYRSTDWTFAHPK